MKSLLRIIDLNTNDDVIKIREAVARNEGIIACEVNISKKEIVVVYDDRAINLDDIIASIEENGYNVV